MTLATYIRILRERWMIIASAVLVALFAGVALFALTPPQYTSRITLYVAAQNTGNTSQGAYQGAQLSEQRVTSYVQLVTSPRVARDVVTRLGLRTSPSALAQQISASTALDSVLIDVTARDTDAQQAKAIADAVGTQMRDLVNELERPTAPGAAQSVELRIVEPAILPDQPSSMGLRSILTTALLLGIAAGVALALARNALDNTIKSVDVMREQSDAPLLGALALDANAGTSPLVVQDNPNSPAAEHYRQLRTNLQFVDINATSRVILLTSPLPSEGKSTTVANLAISLSASSSRVLVIAADLRKPSIERLLHLDSTVGLTTVLTGRIPLHDAVQTWGGRFDVLATGQLPPNPGELLGSPAMRAVLEQCRQRYDIVLIDTPPLLPVADAAALSPFTDGAIVIARYKKTTKGQLRAALQALHAVSAPVLGTLLTMTPMKGRSAYGYAAATYYGEEGGPPPRGTGPMPTGSTPPPPPPPPANSRVATRHPDSSRGSY